MIKWDSYYFLILFIPAIYIFYIVMTWFGCTPISEIDAYRHIMVEENIPEGSTCFSDNRMQYITFYFYPPIEDNLFYFGTLVLLLIVLSGFLIRPVLRSMSSKWMRFFNHSYKKKL